MTGSPILNRFTPFPFSATTPENSWPKGPGMGMSECPRRNALRSVPQVSAVFTFTSNSPQPEQDVQPRRPQCSPVLSG